MKSFAGPMDTMLNRLERQYGHLAIPNLLNYVVILNGVMFALLLGRPEYVQALTLNPQAVLGGQVWRLVSYIFIPPFVHPIFMIFALLLMWRFAQGLEEVWGSFRVNVFYLCGMLGTTIFALISGGAAGNGYLNATVFFAFATLFPDYRLMLFFILPVPVKWLALISVGFLLLAFLPAPWAHKLAMIAAFANYLLFFGPRLADHLRTSAEVAKRRARFEQAQRQDPDETLHRCNLCGATEITHPDRGFRVRDDDSEICEVCLEQSRKTSKA